MNKASDLLSEFEALDSTEWLLKIEKYLKGKPFDSIVQHLEPGVEVKPFYRKSETASIALPILGNNHWHIAETFVCKGDTKAVNALIKQALNGGIDLIHLYIDGLTPDALGTLLDGVHLQMIALQISGPSVEAAPLTWVKSLAAIEGAVDCQGALVLQDWSVEKLLPIGAEMAKLLPNWTWCDIEILNSNEGPAHRLAQALKKAVLYFDTLQTAGISPEKAQRLMQVRLTLDDDYFACIALLRAFKRLWLGLLEAYGVEQAQWPKIMTGTGKSSASDDMYWNMISNTTQALSAAVAQVYSIEVRPSDGLETSSNFSRRIARNVQHLLKMESHIDHAIDPSAGSYYIENYTTVLIKKAWELLQE